MRDPGAPSFEGFAAPIKERYRLVRELGQGGMGTVYLARDLLHPEAPLALKLLDASPEHIPLFKHEFQLLSELRHEAILEVYDFGVVKQEGREAFFYTSELVDGAQLDAAGLTTEELLTVTEQLLDALGFIHERGLIHFDIKPENILVRPGRPPRVTIMDFGLAAPERREAGGSARGTVHFLAPEVIREQPCDRRVDLYALGVSLYALTTGQLPFTGDDALEVMKKHLGELPEPPSTLEPHVPEGLSRFILRLLEKNPADRYSDADAARADLARSLDRPPPPLRARARGSLLSGRFVGREAILDAARDALPAPGAGPRLVTLSGPAGIGKTRLLQELRVHAQFHDIPFLSARGARRGEEPGEGLRRILHEALLLARERGAEGLAERARLQLDDAAELSPPPALHAAAARSLIELAQRGPLTLTIEDAPALEETGQSVLRALLGELPTLGPEVALTLILSWREGEGGELAEAAAEVAEALPGALQLELPPLSEAESISLVGSMLALDAPPAALGARLHEAAAGHPVFLEELLRHLLETGLVSLRTGLAAGQGLDELELAGTLSELLGARLAGLPEAPRAALEALAVLARPAELQLLAEVVGSTPDALLGALDALHARGMLAEAPGAVVALRTRTLAEVALGALDGAARRAWHGRIARALAAREGGSEAALAWHADEAGEAGLARDAHAAAGRRALKEQRLEEARGHLQRAQELGAEDPELWAGLGLAAGVTGRFEHAARALSQAAAWFAQRGAPGQLQCLRRLAMVELKRGRFEAAQAALREALQRAGPEDGAERARLLTTAARIQLWRGDYWRAGALAEESLAEGAGRSRRAAQRILSIAERYLGRFEASTRHLQASLEALTEVEDAVEAEVAASVGVSVEGLRAELAEGRARMCPFGDGFGMIIAFTELGGALEVTGRVARAQAFAEACLAAYERMGDRQRLATALNNAGVYSRVAGELGIAHARFERALSIAEGMGDEHGASLTLTNLALLATSLGAPEVAARHARRVLELARRAGITWLQGHAYRVLGRALAARGEAAEGDRMEQRAEGVFRMLGDRRNLSDTLLDRAELALAEPALARARLRDAAEAEPQRRPPDAAARRALIEAALAEEPAAALPHLEDALEAALRSGVAELEGRVRDAFAEVSEALGVAVLAADHIGRAQELDDRGRRGLPAELARSEAAAPARVAARERRARLRRSLEED